MKRNFYLIGAALISMTMFSCSQEDITTDSAATNGQIGFSALATGKTRMAGDITNENVNNAANDFGVWGYKGGSTQVFNNQQVTYNTTDLWNYTPVRFWDTQKSYLFNALMPYTAAATFDQTTGITLGGIATPALSTTGIDYLVATQVSANGADKKLVEFKFNHILSKFNVLAKAKVIAGGQYKVTLNSMKIDLPDGTATYTQKTAADVTTFGAGSTACDAWTFTAGTAAKEDIQTAEVALDDNVGTDNYKKLANSYFVAPTPVTAAGVRTQVNLTMDVTFKVTFDNNKNGAIDAADGDYEETYTYTDVPVQDLHNFTQGYMTNLYVLFDMSLGTPSNPNPNVIKFAVDEVKEWIDSDDNYIDNNGYSFSLATSGPGSTLENAAAADQTTPVRVPLTIDNYGNTVVSTTTNAITYTFSGTDLTFYSAATGGTALTGAQTLTFTGNKATVYVELPSNTTAVAKTYTATVTTNQENGAAVYDARSIKLYQKAINPTATFTYNGAAVAPGATITYVAGQNLVMTLANTEFDADGVIVTVSCDDAAHAYDLDITWNGTTKTHYFDAVKSTSTTAIETAAGASKYTIELRSKKDLTLYTKYEFNQ